MNLTFDWLLSQTVGIHNENQGKTELYAFYGYVKLN